MNEKLHTKSPYIGVTKLIFFFKFHFYSTRKTHSKSVLVLRIQEKNLSELIIHPLT